MKVEIKLIVQYCILKFNVDQPSTLPVWMSFEPVAANKNMDSKTFIISRLRICHYASDDHINDSLTSFSRN